MDRLTVKLLGVVLGTASGWDGEDLTYNYYDFIPADGIKLPKGDITISYDNGDITKWNGETEQDDDILSVTSAISGLFS